MVPTTNFQSRDSLTVVRRGLTTPPKLKETTFGPSDKITPCAGLVCIKDDTILVRICDICTSSRLGSLLPNGDGPSSPVFPSLCTAARCQVRQIPEYDTYAAAYSSNTIYNMCRLLPLVHLFDPLHSKAMHFTSLLVFVALTILTSTRASPVSQLSF